ncbi:MAG: aldo/keto reductase [Asgard group archaeon]|nr:aldo/keto reductase [Asgard group archaeon]
MEKRKLGKTGIETSILGFGAMRLPTLELGKPNIDHEKAIKAIRKGIDAGINYLDTAYNYHDYESEIVVGKALKDGYREKVTLVTKCPVWDDEKFTKTEDFDKFLDDSLKKLDVEYLDIYLLHALNQKRWTEKIQPLKLIEQAKKAKEDGRIKFIGFSFHDKPEVLKEIIDSEGFDVMLVQYNILDTANEAMIKYAAEKGLGVIIMGPVGGGRLAGNPPEEMKHLLSDGRNNFTDLALKFVWSNPGVSVALSGMGSEEMVDDNIAIANSKDTTLTRDEFVKVKKIETKFKELTDLICTSCNYCMPCPNEVNISFIFRSMIYAQVYGQEERAILHYSKIGEEDWPPGKRADACIECGECEPKCPQKIPIIDQLKKAHELLKT